MKSLRLFVGALLLVGAAASPALMAQCPTGQRVLQVQNPTGVVRVVLVPGSAGGFPSGIMIRPGFRYVMTAAGSIRVGVIGETGTPPDGWVPQGPAGNGFPDPDAPTFSLLFRIGATGPWQLLGSGQATAYLGASDAPGSQIQFGINDNKLGDNTGLFNVVLTEFVMGTRCGVPPQPPPPMGGSYRPGTSSGTPQVSSGPCGSQTPNGQMQSFQFSAICPGLYTRVFPAQACTRESALTQAQALARSDNCSLTTN